MYFNKILRFSSDPSSRTPLAITLMILGSIYYFYSKKSSSNSSAPKKEESSSNSPEPETMASTSTIQNRFKYDVFISFRGEDTRKNFVDHLYHALKAKGIYTYKDDKKIQKGKRISDDLFKSIEDSKFYIIVFSKNYASSSWCLEELVKIMECQRMTGHIAYPVFYDVEPTEVCKQIGAVGKAFDKHKKEEAAGKWREALKEAADLAGWELKNTLDGHEAEFVKRIVQHISLELRSINPGFDEKLVGMETRVKDVVSCLEVGADEVRMIGIKGMGGIGKTTTASSIFNHLSTDFEAKSFVENVREVSTTLGLKKLQEQVLSKVLKEDVTVDSVNDGKKMMKERMCGIKVLLVLDDVDHIEQLEALASASWFKPGSIILITTRDEQVLKAHGVKLIRDINLLSEQEAIYLFSRNAFGTKNPVQGYEELSGKVVQYAAGLPLTIKVLGSFLCGKDTDDWEDAIERLKDIPLKETLEKLELSYIGLEDDYKEIFLDIACIFKGRNKRETITILESCGFHARSGLRVLEQRALITVDEYEYLYMHDHIEEMGKNIVRRLHPDEPNKHSRLWNDEEIRDILANDKGTDATRCLKLTTSGRNSRIVMKGIEKMNKLRYLEVNFVNCDVFLSFWGEGTHKNFVDDLYEALMDKGIYTYKDDEKKQKGERISDELITTIEDSKFHIIIFSKNYASSSWCLEELVKIMECCQKTIKPIAYPVFFDVEPTEVRKQSGAVGEAFFKNKNKEAAEKWKGALKEAADLAGWDLKNIKDGHEANLISTIVQQLSRELRFTNSVGHGKLIRMGTEAMRNAINDNWEIDTERLCSDPKSDNTSQLDESSQYFTNSLKFLKCTNWPFLYLPNTLQANNLVGLDVWGKRMVQLSKDGEKKVLKKLKFFSLSWSKLTNFDFRITPNLKTLSLETSYDLEELCMPASCQKLTYLRIGYSKLRTFDLGLTPNLETLDLYYCSHFKKLHVSAPCPNLKSLNLSKSRLRILDLELIPNLERLDLEESKELVEINAPVGCVNKVVELKLYGCALLEKLPEDLGRSGCLKELDIIDTGIRELPQSVFGLKGLCINASKELLQQYDFPSEITTTTDPW